MLLQVFNPVQNSNPYSLQYSTYTAPIQDVNTNNVSFNSQLNNNNQFNQFSQPQLPQQSEITQPIYAETSNVLQEDKKYPPPPPPDNFSDTLYLMNQQKNLPDPPINNSSQVPLLQNQQLDYQSQKSDPLDSFSTHQPFEMFPNPTPPVSNYVEQTVEQTSNQLYTGFSDFNAPSTTIESTPQNPIEMNLVDSNKDNVDIVENDAGVFNMNTLQVNSAEIPRMMQVTLSTSQQDHHKTNADRDNYIVTGQLSQENLPNVGLPPPGLSRMVVGQNENNDASQVQFANDPTMGLNRMVTGTENTPYLNYQREIDGEVSSPPQPIMRVPSPQSTQVSTEVNNFMNYQRQADGEVAIDQSLRPIEHPTQTLTSDRSSYFVTGGTESQPDSQRFVPGVESDISTQMHSLQIGDNNDFASNIPNRDNEVEGIDVTSREENIDGANDNSEASNTISDRNEVETNAREGAIDGYDNKNDENIRSTLDTSDDDKEIQELELAASKSRSKSRKHNDSFDSDSHKSREKPYKEDLDRKDRHGHTSNYSDSRRRNDDSDEYYRKREKKRTSRTKKYSDNEEYGSERDRTKRNRYKEKDRDSGRKSKSKKIPFDLSIY
jgi:hypothetical protein